MPRGFSDFIPRDRLAEADTGAFIPQTYGIPHWRILSRSGRHHGAPEGHPLYDLGTDPGETSPLEDEALQRKYETKLRDLLTRYGAPDCHFSWLGLG
mgnify:CR=1